MRTRLRRKPVTIHLWDRESSEMGEVVGGGIESGNPCLIAILLDISPDWITYRWKHSGEIVIVPARDVICIASDPPSKESR